ncbi:SIR2 family protein [Candidatus Bathyarchaeota archaeon]|nr:SIR2 family protein [Candidatus Bathyarchaeota archaeon]
MTFRVLVFLGAGASVPFNIPDSKQLADLVERDLTHYSKRIKDTRQHAKMYGFRNDIETILSVLEFWTNPRRMIYEMGAFFSEITKYNLGSLKPNKRDKRIALRIKEYIVRRCCVNDASTTELIFTIYGKFFKDTSNCFDLGNCNPAGRDTCPPLDVFTTNYDNTIEEYCRRNGLALYDGYREETRGNYRFDPYYYEQASTILRLFKLHGTITYAKLDNGDIDRVAFYPPRGSLVIAGRPAFPDLIYPGTYSYIAKEPQLELLYLLKEKLTLCDLCVVVGYEFGDPNVWQIFLDAYERNRDIKVILVSPNAKGIVRRRHLPSSSFIAVPKKFEQLDVDADIKAVL